MKACLQLQPEFCSRDNLLNFTSRYNRMRNLHKKLLPFVQHGFLKSEKNVNLNNFPTLDGVWVLVCPAILWTSWCKLTKTMADVVSYLERQMVCLGRCYCHLMCGRCFLNKFNSFSETILKLHEFKQNDKYPHTYMTRIWKGKWHFFLLCLSNLPLTSLRNT